MSDLAPDLATSKIDCGNTARRDEHAGERARHTVDEHRPRGKFRASERRPDNCIVADLVLHRHLDASAVVEAVWAEAEIALAEIERDALRLSAVVAAGMKAEVSPADQTVQAFRRCGNGGASGHEAKNARDLEITYG